MNHTTVQNFIGSLDTAFQDNDARVAEKTTEAANVALLQELYRVIARGDFAQLPPLFAADIVMEIVGPAQVPFVGQWQGAEQVANQIASNFAHLEDQHPTIHSLVAQGDMIVVQAQEKGRLKATGQSYHLHWVQTFTFQNGKLQRFREVFDSGSLPAS
jgi:ketosteroid isomerase-like protein